jgi:phosphosulfolactate synthase (CoM biosynthesis protein A)
MLIREFLTLPPRSRKPRETGITLVLDKGIGLRQMEDLLASAADYVDLVKLGWGTGYISHDLRDKIKVYQQAGIPVYFGGTLLELAILQDRVDEYREMALSLGVSHVELSTGIIDLSVAEKVRYIRGLGQWGGIPGRAASPCGARPSGGLMSSSRHGPGLPGLKAAPAPDPAASSRIP